MIRPDRDPVVLRARTQLADVVDQAEKTAAAAAAAAGGGRWRHAGHSYDVHAEPYGNPVAVGPHSCGLFDAGTHIAAVDPRTVTRVCGAVRRLLDDHDQAVRAATAPDAGMVAMGWARGLGHAVVTLAGAATEPDSDSGEDTGPLPEPSLPDAGARVAPARWAGTEPVDPPDPDLDDIPVAELVELDGPAASVAVALTQVTAAARAGATGHLVGTFLDLLAAHGYRVTLIDPGPPIADLLPPPTE